jgi:hypothetical protein
MADNIWNTLKQQMANAGKPQGNDWNDLNTIKAGLGGKAVGDIKELPMYQQLVSMLQGGYTQGLPYKDQLLQTSTGAINQQYGNASKDLNDMMSGRGLGKSGIGIQAQANLSGKQSTALNQATGQLNEQDIAYRNQAMLNLLGLNTAEGNYGLQQNQQQLSALQTLLSGRLQEDKQNEENKFDWGSVLKDIGSLAAAPLTGGTSLLGLLVGGGKSGISGMAGNPGGISSGANAAINNPLPF